MSTMSKRRAAVLWWPLMLLGVGLLLVSFPLTMTLNGLGLLGLALSSAGVIGMSTEVRK